MPKYLVYMRSEGKAEILLSKWFHDRNEAIDYASNEFKIPKKIIFAKKWGR